MTQNTDFTVADVLAWARTKPAGARYEYGDNDNCALCQFLRETARALQPRVGGISWCDKGKDEAWGTHEFPDGLTNALIEHTFGGLVSRLETLSPETPVYTGAAPYTASLDAAMTLADGCGGEVTFFKDGTAKAFLWQPYPMAVEAKAATPALALCAAALRARADAHD